MFPLLDSSFRAQFVFHSPPIFNYIPFSIQSAISSTPILLAYITDQKINIIEVFTSSGHGLLAFDPLIADILFNDVDLL